MRICGYHAAEIYQSAQLVMKNSTNCAIRFTAFLTLKEFVSTSYYLTKTLNYLQYTFKQ